MYRSVDDFLKDWAGEVEKTHQVMSAMTDRSLMQRVDPEDRTLGRIAWHLVTTMPEMMERTGITVAGPSHDSEPPVSAKAIADAYAASAKSLAEGVKSRWSDATLHAEDDMYGMRWKRGETLMALLVHQVHHRGQMTVLLRQAGIKPPGLYGPAREDWATMGMQPPKV